MSWFCMEGFDGLGTYDQLPLRSWRDVGAGLTYSASGGRRGGGCIVDNTTGSTTERGIEFSTTFFDTTFERFAGVATATGADHEIGLAIKIDGDFASLLTEGWTYPIASVLYGSTEVMYWDLYYQAAAGNFYIRQRYGTTTRLNAAAVRLSESGRWYYLTFLISGINSTAASNSSHVLVDDVAAGTVSSVGINASTSVTPSILRLGAAQGVSANLPVGMSISFDDVVGMVSGTVSTIPTPIVASTQVASTYVGPCRVDKVVGATANGYYNTFDPSAGAVQHEMVDETGAHDGDSTYISSSTIGEHGDGGRNGALPVTPLAIKGIRTFAVVRNAGDGPANVRAGMSYFGSKTSANQTRTLAAESAYTGLMSHGCSHEGAVTGTTPWTDLTQAAMHVEYVS